MQYLVQCILLSVRFHLVISSPTAAATPRLKELTNALDSVVDWYPLGVQLGLKDHELRTISRDFPWDNERCKLEMLGRWLRNVELPTWKAVADALHLMGEGRVASKIRAKYCRSSTDTGMCLQLRIMPLTEIVFSPSDWSECCL